MTLCWVQIGGGWSVTAAVTGIRNLPWVLGRTECRA